MLIEFDGAEVAGAAAHLERRVEAARQLLAAAARLEGELVDEHLALAAAALADLTGDSAELAALDLHLLVMRLRAGARQLDDTERALSCPGQP